MMYPIKCIISHDIGNIDLPKCMYRIKNPNENLVIGECDLKICEQVIKFLKTPNKKMIDLEKRQNELLHKLDVLYDRIQSISAICSVTSTNETTSARTKKKISIQLPEEMVMVFGPDNLPWFWNLLKSLLPNIKVTWHIHSSVPNEKVPKIQSFVKIFDGDIKSHSNVRLIFKDVSADSELKLSSLDIPIIGTVNILRYLSYVFPSVIPYDPEDFNLEALLDLCHILERADKSKDSIVKKIFSGCKDWIYNNEFSIVDLAAYNIIKQWQNAGKSVPSSWLDRCHKMSI